MGHPVSTPNAPQNPEQPETEPGPRLPVPGGETDAARVYREYLSAVMLHGHASARACDLGATDLYALNILQLGGPMTPGELGTRTGLTTGPTTRLVDRLERAGYVRRTPDPEDRRKVIVEPVGKPADLDLVMAPRPPEDRRDPARLLGRTAPHPVRLLHAGHQRLPGGRRTTRHPHPPPRNDRRRRSRERAAGHHRGGRTGLRRPARRAERPVGTDGPPPPRPAGPQGCRREHRHARPVPAPGTRKCPPLCVTADQRAFDGVEPRGVEPLTSAMQRRRSTN
ncbi:hypothetical protein GCM10020256_37480 [Streptomyces thermocoprophilus]